MTFTTLTENYSNEAVIDGFMKICAKVHKTEKFCNKAEISNKKLQL